MVQRNAPRRLLLQVEDPDGEELLDVVREAPRRGEEKVPGDETTKQRLICQTAVERVLDVHVEQVVANGRQKAVKHWRSVDLGHGTLP